MKTITKLCRDCGNPIESTDPRRVICESCRKKKLEEKKDAVRSLAVEDSSRRAAATRHKGAPYKSISQCVREADAMASATGSMWLAGWIGVEQDDAQKVHQDPDEPGRAAK